VRMSEHILCVPVTQSRGMPSVGSMMAGRKLPPKGEWQANTWHRVKASCMTLLNVSLVLLRRSP
jgi:hypothetical protein